MAETRIVCGWCGGPAIDGDPCPDCGRDPRLAWTHRGLEPPAVASASGRPTLGAAEARQLYEAAKSAVEERGATATVDAIAEELDRSPRTVRRWRDTFGLR